MKYDVIQNADGNTSIVSTWNNNLNGAKQAFHNQCKLLYSDAGTTVATVGIYDERLNLVDSMKEFIDKTVPEPIKHLVSFNTYGGSSIEPVFVNDGDTVTRPEDPTYEGHTLVGWELNGYPYDFSLPVYETIVLVAKWEEVSE